jgi:hypothetical protein
MKITTQSALTLRAALPALDGLDKAVEVNGKTALVKKPFKFSGKTRLKIARNLRACEQVFLDYDAARAGLVRELADGGESVPAEKLSQFHQQHAALLQEPQEVALTPLREEDLNLDDNEIPHAVVAVILTHLIEDPRKDAEAQN